MGRLIINGGKPLYGELTVQGSKNSVLPILAAALLGDGESVIENCPALSDTDAACEILRHLGCRVVRTGNEIRALRERAGTFDIPDELMRRMRSSVMFLGAILATEGRARISFPGGCELGPRPIDLHLAALRQMGARFSQEGGYLNCDCPDGLSGAEIGLALPSVGATENIMLAAVTARGETVLQNAAREPEITDLQNFLNKMGAKITGGGTGTMRIVGVPRLKGARHRVIPDRIVAVTYLAAVCACGGEVTLKNADAAHLSATLSLLSEMGARLILDGERIVVYANKRLLAPRTVRTAYYPGFPTDAQALMMALASVCEGSSLFIETVFQNRYRHVGELRRMGAKIRVEGRVAVVEGRERLSGATVEATDLRGGAALLVAGLNAAGVTTVEKTEHIDRGYEAPEAVLRALGADIVREENEL